MQLADSFPNFLVNLKIFVWKFVCISIMTFSRGTSNQFSSKWPLASFYGYAKRRLAKNISKYLPLGPRKCWNAPECGFGWQSASKLKKKKKHSESYNISSSSKYKIFYYISVFNFVIQYMVRKTNAYSAAIQKYFQWKKKNECIHENLYRLNSIYTQNSNGIHL